jgi:dTDP-4-amino-4,6-dideoxygalactose transaminase
MTTTSPETSTTPVRTTPFPSWPQWGSEELAGLTNVLESGIWGDANGPVVRALEADYAAFVQADHALACSNGTVAIVLALRALGIGSGDEVIVPPYTFLATATAVLEVNALPIFADIDPNTWCIDPAAVEAAITERTRAIIAVHFGGHPADLDALKQIATRHGVALIEDCAHAHGAMWNNHRVGAIGDMGTWSFQASKNLTCGEGGMVTTNNPELAETIESLRNCGRSKNGVWYAHYIMSGNFRLTEWQSTILQEQLRRYPPQLERRNANGLLLDAALGEIEGITPVQRDPRCTMHTYHVYQFRFDQAGFDNLSRDEFVQRMQAEGIPLSAGYPLPLNKQPVFLNRAFDLKATGYDPDYAPTRFQSLDLPVCQDACETAVWIGQNVLLGDEQDMQDIVTAVRKVRDSARR